MQPVSTIKRKEHPAASATETLAQTLAMQIVTGQLKDNDRLQESKLCQQFNASRGTVREALLSLQQHKLVTLHPNKGASVTALDAGAIRALFEVASCHFGLIACKAAMRISSSEQALLAINFAVAEEAFSTQQPLQLMFAYLSIFETLVYVYANTYSTHLFAQLSVNLQRCIYIQQSTHTSLSDDYMALLTDLRQGIDAQNLPLIRSSSETWLAKLCQDTLQSYKRIKQIELAYVKRQAGC